MINKFINDITQRGNKSISSKLFLKTLVLAKNSNTRSSIGSFLKKGSINSQPKITLDNKKIAGSIIRVPKPYGDLNSHNLSIKFLVNNSKKKGPLPFYKKLYNEIVETSNKRGFSFKKKVGIHRAGLDNRSNIKYS